MKNKLFNSFLIILMLTIALQACKKSDVEPEVKPPVVLPDTTNNLPDTINVNVQVFALKGLIYLGNGENYRIGSAAGGEVLNLFDKQARSSSYMKDAYLHNFDKIPDFEYKLLWNLGGYEQINKANIVLSDLDSVKIKPTAKRKLLAEVKVARAYFFYQVMDNFGNIPLDTLYGVNPTTIKTNTRLQVFNFIEKELKENVPLLDTKIRADKPFNQYVGYTLMAQLYLNAQVYTGVARWEDALLACDKVLQSGPYSLSPNYFDNFAANNATNENILVSKRDNKQFYNNTFILENVYEIDGAKAIGVTGSAWNAFAGSADMYNIYEAADKRRRMWLIGPQKEANAGERQIDGVPNTGADIKIMSRGKEVPLNYTLATPRFGFLNPGGVNSIQIQSMAGVRNVKYYPRKGALLENQDLENDYVLMRLADIILMKAEAQLRLGNSAGAAIELNKVRLRAFGNSSFNINNPSLSDIKDERARELMWEGYSRRDNIRFEVANPSTPYWSKAKILKPLADVGAVVGSGRFDNMIYPIPSSQLLLYPKLVQNPGYF
jgi:starch-binding outer membrane protein, SusD/RagB family